MSRTYWHRHFRKPWKLNALCRRLIVHKRNRQRSRQIQFKLAVDLEQVWPKRRIHEDHDFS